MAALVDLVHGLCPGCARALLSEADTRVFVLCAEQEHAEPLARPGRRVRALCSASMVENLLQVKQAADLREISHIRVLSSPGGARILRRYLRLLFTAVYVLEHAHAQGCAACRERACAEVEEEGVCAEVASYLRGLPGLRGEITLLTSSLLPGCFGHGFSTRAGGVSYIPTLSALNLFSSSRRRDPVSVVEENRRRLAVHAGFYPLPLRLVKVNHANQVWVLGREEPESYDAMVTDQRGVVLAAPGADCMPVLFADPVRKVIGAAHAGWKGTVTGVAVATVQAMASEFGCRVSDVLVAVGPSVGRCCFTLSQQEALDFLRVRPDCVPDPESARPHVDIRLANRVLLQNAGVPPENIHDHTEQNRACVTPCTACDPERFFSHVRDGNNFGTQLGFVWIREPAGPEPDHQNKMAS